MYIILAIIAFDILIAMHEFGHFLAAKACGVAVEEFSLGMGPAIFKKQGKNTLFSVRALPIGGFCAMRGEDEGETADSFYAQRPVKKAIILVAGALMNLLAGFILILCIIPNTSIVEPTIVSFYDGCPYEGEEAFMTGDRIYKIDGHRIYFSGNVPDYLSRGSTHDITLIRDGRKVTLRDFYMPKVEYSLQGGGSTFMYGLVFSGRQEGVLATIRYASYQCSDFVRMIWRGLIELITGSVKVTELSGPVGIVNMVSEVTESAESTGEAMHNFSFIFGLIAVNLAVMNLLPLPALDGGRIFALIIISIVEKIIGRKPDPKYEAMIHTGGLILLMGLMFFVMASDIIKLFK
ncbi:MAG: site-2 protease family protein [Oscillospiraceae bacterium]|nr:site-2 protease family protein [Oscillospiraceae bacterium]